MEETEAILGHLFIDGGTQLEQGAKNEVLVDVYWYKTREDVDPLRLPMRPKFGSQSRVVKEEGVDSNNYISGSRQGSTLTSERHIAEELVSLAAVQRKGSPQIKNEPINSKTWWQEVEELTNSYVYQVKRAKIKEEPRNIVTEKQEDEDLTNSDPFDFTGSIQIKDELSDIVTRNEDAQGGEEEWEDTKEFKQPLIQSHPEIDPLALPWRRPSTSDWGTGKQEFKEEGVTRHDFEYKPPNSDSNTDETIVPNGEEQLAWGSGVVEETESPTSQRRVRKTTNSWPNGEKRFQRIPCEYCDEIFVTRHGYVSHVRAHLNKFRFLCATCGRGFPRRRSLNIHSKTHSSRPLHECSLCDKTYMSRHGLVKHVTTHSGVTYPCALGGKTLLSVNGLRKHEKLHKRVETYTCETCGRQLKSKTTLATHVLTHNADRPHVCAVCHKSYAVKFLLTRHLKAHAQVHYSCGLCTRVYAAKVDLEKHILFHSAGHKSSVCAVCGKSFKTRNYLTQHRQMHAGLRGHVCTTCGKEFSTKGNLGRHVVTHEAEGRLHLCV